MINKLAPAKKRPGARLLAIGLAVLALGVMVLLLNITNPVTNYVAGLGMVKTQSPSAGSMLLIVAGLILSVIGFGKRMLAAVEK